VLPDSVRRFCGKNNVYSTDLETSIGAQLQYHFCLIMDILLGTIKILVDLLYEHANVVISLVILFSVGLIIFLGFYVHYYYNNLVRVSLNFVICRITAGTPLHRLNFERVYFCLNFSYL
jgi:hypothetical protein